MLKIKEKPKKVKFKVEYHNNNQKKIKKLIMYLQSELESSTTHGLPYIVNMDLHWFERLFWTVSFVICAAIMFFLLSSQYARFLAAPIVMSVEMDYFNWNVSFPAITLCPLNKLDEDLQAAFINDSFLETEVHQDLGPYLEAISLASLDSIHHLEIPAPEILRLINSSDYAKVAAQIFGKFENTSLTTNTNWPMSIEPVMTEMGMCHVINSNVAIADNPSKWSESIAYTKSNIELSFHDSDFYVQIQNYADSFKIYTYSPNDIILSGASALTFNNEGFLQFGVQMSSTRASPDLRPMPLYLRKCRFVDEPDSRRYPVYSYNRCVMECRIRMIKTLCGCIPHFYKPIGDEKVCNLEELMCLVIYKNEIATLSVNNKTVSIEKFAEVGSLPKNTRECGCLENCEADYYRQELESFVSQGDMNRLKILVATFPKVRIRREIIFSFYDVMLRSGGVVNLCIGTSVISIMELIMTVIRIPIYEIIRVLKCIYRKRRKSKVMYFNKKNK